MNVLLVVAFAPNPDGHGGNLAVYHLAHELAARHRVHLVTTGHPVPMDGITMTVVDVKEQQTLPERVWRGAKSMITREPATSRLFRDAGFGTAVGQAARQAAFDVAYVSPTVVSFADGALGRLPRVLGVGDAWYRKRTEEALAAGNLSVLRRLSIGTIPPYERAALRRYDAVTVVSEDDRQALLALDPEVDVEVIPNGVDAAFYAAPQGVSRQAGLLVFHGVLDYSVNVDAAEYLVREILPLVQRDEPDVRVRLIGRNPDRRVRALAGPRVEVTGPVPLIGAALAEGAVGVYPMRRGTGIKNKVLEAAAAAMPLVTTTLGLGVIDLRPGEDLLVADDPAGLAAAIVTLLRSEEMRTTMGARARAGMVERWSWEAMAERYSSLFSRIADQPRVRRD